MNILAGFMMVCGWNDTNYGSVSLVIFLLRSFGE